MNSKIHITVEERLLLHLLDYSKYEDAYDVPISLSQEGIAKAINIRRNDVSRTIKNIINKGWVDVRLGHVEGVGRRRKVYFLTPSGYTNALKIKDAILELEVPIVEKDGKDRLRIKDINQFFNIKYSIIEMVNIVNKLGKFDPFYDLEEPLPETAEERRIVHSLETGPKLERFIGRDDEIEKLEGWTEEGKVIILKGIAGIGKSYLAFKLCENLMESHNLLWIKVKEFDSLDKILEVFSDFLQEAKLKDFSNYVSKNRNYDLNEVQDLLEEDLKKMGPTLIVIDDLQKASPLILQFFSILVDIKDSLNSVTYLFTGRYAPKFYDRRQVVVERKIIEYELTGLDRDSSKELLKEVEIPQRKFDEVYKITHGHPLSLILLVQSKNVESFKEINEYINDEIFSQLDENEKTMLSALSVYREGIPASVLFVEDKLDYNTIDSLLQKLLLFENTDGYYEMHDLLQESIYTRQTPKQRKYYHELASQYYESQKIANAHLEEIYHLMKAEEYERSGKKIIDYAKDLLENKLTIELLYLIRDVKSALKPEILKKYVLKLNDIIGEIYDQWGGWDSIVEYNLQNFMLIRLIRMPKETGSINEDILRELYPHLFSYYTKSNSLDEIKNVQLEDVKTLINIHNSFVDITRSDEEWNQAINDHKESYEFLLSIEDYEGALNMLFELGWIFWRRSEFENAIDTYNKALEMCRKLDKEKQREIRNRINNDLGHLYWINGNHIKALHYYQQALIYYNKLESKEEAIKINNYIGNIYFLLNKLDIAHEQYRISRDMATETWYMNAMTYTNLHMIQVRLLERLQTSLPPEELLTYKEDLEGIKDTFEKINDYAGAKYATLWLMLLE
jgi:DNA-binding MarR family transcriptional regulator